VSPDIGAFVRDQVVARAHLENPITIFLPDGSLGRVWLGSSGVGDEIHWRVNVKAAIGVDQDRVRFTQEPATTTDHNPHGPTPGALQGDAYPLEYYGDGYPKLPACLDCRTRPAMAEAA
jgi:hypothetical protein